MDNYSLWAKRDAELEDALSSLPMCVHCEEHIQDDYYYEIDGEVLCERCMNEQYRRDNYEF